MVLFFADKYHTCPPDVEKIPFQYLCESYDDILMNEERTRMNKQYGTRTYTNKNGQTLRQVHVGEY